MSWFLQTLWKSFNSSTSTKTVNCFVLVSFFITFLNWINYSFILFLNMIIFCINFEKYPLKSIVLWVQFNLGILLWDEFFSSTAMQRMSYTEKKASEISMPSNAPNLRFKLFFYFNKKRYIKLEKVVNTLNYEELRPYSTMTSNLKSLIKCTHSLTPRTLSRRASPLGWWWTLSEFRQYSP